MLREISMNSCYYIMMIVHKCIHYLVIQSYTQDVMCDTKRYIVSDIIRYICDTKCYDNVYVMYRTVYT